MIPVWVLRWLDRREPEPWFMYGLAFLWGGLIATGISGDINRYLDDTLGFLSVVGTGPFVEEITKGLGLLVFLLLLRDEFDGPRDG
ncbi:MAG: PrsW family glutamic-type intramembrane protease [Caldilineaceae bacterium]